MKRVPWPRRSWARSLIRSPGFAARVLTLLTGGLIAAALLPSAARADPVPLGYVAWDLTNPGVSGQFDIVNQTGSNASGDATWPVNTAVPFTDLALTVHYTNGTASVFGSSYFTLGADGASFDGTPIAIGGGSALPTDAALTGLFGVADVTLFDGQTLRLMPSFSASIAFRGGGLADGDLQLIQATPAAVTAVPESATARLVLAGLAALAFARRWRRRGSARRALGGVAAIAGLMASAPAWATVKLNAWTTPTSGAAGTSALSLTATGSEMALGPGNLRVSFAESCGGPAVTAANVSSVKQIIRDSYRVEFVLPVGLTKRTYAASLTGTTASTGSGQATLSSSNCALVNVAAPANGWKTLIGRSWSLPAGEAGVEGARCTTLLVQSDMYISAFRPITPEGEFEKILTVSDTPSPVGDFDCFAPSYYSKGVYMSGPGTGDLAFPPGAAVHVSPGQFLTLYLQIINNSAQLETGQSLIQVQTVDPATVTDPVELIFAGTFLINVPSDGITHTATGACFAPARYRVLALFPHMHAQGTRAFLSVNTVPVFDAPYAVGAQAVYPLASPLSISAFDRVLAQCSYVNTSGTTKSFGDATYDEQCFIGLYRTPVLPVIDPPFDHSQGELRECTGL